MWNGAADALKPRPAITIASPASTSPSLTRPWSSMAAAIAPNSSSPVAPYTSADPKSSTAEPKLPTIRYFSPASSDADPVDLDRAEDVEADREPLQAEEERHQGRRLDEEDHAAATGREQREVLADVLAARSLSVRDPDRQEAGAGHDQLRQRAVPVAHDRVGDLVGRVGALPVEEPGGDAGTDEPERADDRAEDAHGSARDEHGAEEREPGGGEQRQRRREREPVDGRLVHQNERCSVIAAGQAESASRQPTRGTITASSAGRRSRASSGTAGPTSW